MKSCYLSSRIAYALPYILNAKEARTQAGAFSQKALVDREQMTI